MKPVFFCLRSICVQFLRCMIVGVSIILEQNADTFTVVNAADGLEFERSANGSGAIRRFLTYLTHLSENVADL